MLGNVPLVYGMLAGSIPIIIHLIHRTRFKRIVFSAMRWLLEASKKSHRRIQIEQLILLFIRILTLMLLSLAMALPVIQDMGWYGFLLPLPTFGITVLGLALGSAFLLGTWGAVEISSGRSGRMIWAILAVVASLALWMGAPAEGGASPVAYVAILASLLGGVGVLELSNRTKSRLIGRVGLTILSLVLAGSAYHEYRRLSAAEDGRTGGALTDRIHRVVILDRSYSMGLRAGPSAVFDRAKRLAASLVSDKDPRLARVSLYLMDEDAERIGSGDRNARGTLVGEIERARRADVGTSLAKSLNRIYAEEFRDTPKGRREVFLITDGTAVGWLTEEGVVRDRESLQQLRALVREQGQTGLLPYLYVADVGESDNDTNLAVSDIEPLLPVTAVRQPARFKVRVRNFGSTEASQVAVRLFAVDGPPPSGSTNETDSGPEAAGEASAAISPRVIEKLPPHGEAEVTFDYRFDTSGPKRVWASIESDRLPVDDRRFLALSVQPDLPVLVVNGAPTSGGGTSETFALNKALNPTAESARSDAPVSFIRVEEISDEDLPQTELDGYSVLFLCNMGTVSAAKRDAVVRFLQSGGGVVVFPGDRLDATLYNEQFYPIDRSASARVLPAQLGEATGDAESRETALHLNELDTNHPILRIFEKWPGLSQGNVYRFIRCTVDPADSDVRVLARMTDPNRSPAILERIFRWKNEKGENREGGRVLLFTFPADRDWSDLPLRQAWPPMLHEVVYHLSQGDRQARNRPVGARFHIELRTRQVSDKIMVQSPEGTTLEVQPRKEGGRLFAEFPAEGEASIGRRAGWWTAQVGADSTAENAFHLFAANVDVREGNLESIGSDRLREILGADFPFEVIDRADEHRIRELLERRSSFREVSLPLLVMVLVFLIAESYLAQRFGDPKRK